MEFYLLDQLQQLRTPLLDAAFCLLTQLGDKGLCWILLSCLLLYRRQTRRLGVLLIIALVAQQLCTSLCLKPLVARPRPCDLNSAVQLLIARPQGYSFPSGHAASSFACVSVLYAAGSSWWRPALLLALGISLSRLYLYVHFPTDVLAGALIGACIGLLTVRLSRLL